MDESVSILVKTTNEISDFLFGWSLSLAEFIVDIFHERFDLFGVEESGFIFIVLLVDHINHFVELLLGVFAH